MKHKILVTFIILLTAALVIPGVGAQDETEVIFIELDGPVADRDAEISSLVWYGDWLIFVTENPFIFKEEGDAGKFFALEKDDIYDYLAADDPEDLEPQPIPLIADDIELTVGGYAIAFDGFEAAAVVTDVGFLSEDRIFLTIEADTVSEDDPSMRGYIVSGTIAPDLSSITLDLDNFAEVPRQTEFNNMSYESLTVVDGKLVAFYEVNGEAVNPDNVAYAFDLQTGEMTTIDFPNINFRLTDVTTIAEDGTFWGINYFFVGEDFLAVESDPIFETYGIGASQAQYDGYERLVQFRYVDGAFVLVDTAPIQLLMTDDSRGRNWEGIARLDDVGLLIVTDRFPDTLLGYVPF